MATLAPAYSLVISAVLAAVELEMALLIACVPFVVVSAIPLLARGSRAFNGACYTATVLLVCGGCISGGVWFLPAALPLLFATPPGLRAPIPQACVAAILAAIVVTILIIFQTVSAKTRPYGHERALTDLRQMTPCSERIAEARV
ncbi:hypothetical protein [Actinoplanes xinjiangensis]|uniref:hypothetical protein n=1 Tax=Actinoplanes xinjiangensis TaxID=512350 RepID=UPI0011B56179|nr:hypothetical protein [Actinoplanes xinjiangensis]GIF42353.1 hypothetical protein Axi01nite_66640 [Actinoplanes xinjiangensis]